MSQTQREVFEDLLDDECSEESKAGWRKRFEAASPVGLCDRERDQLVMALVKVVVMSLANYGKVVRLSDALELVGSHCEHRLLSMKEEDGRISFSWEKP